MSDMGQPRLIGRVLNGWRLWGMLACLAVGMVAVPGCSNAEKDSLMTMRCQLRMKDIATAIVLYRQANGSYPPAVVTDSDGKPMHSWRVLILPYLGDEVAQQIFDEYDFEQPWDAPHNRALGEKMPEWFACEAGGAKPNETNYLAVVGEETVWPPAGSRPCRFIADGNGATILLVEAKEPVYWLEPRDLSLAEAIATPTGLGSGHPTGISVAFADTHMERISGPVDLELLRALLTVAGGEDVGSSPYLMDDI